MKLGIEHVTVRLRRPFVSATGSVDSRELLLVSVTGADGLTGYGEAAPLEHYDGVSLDACRSALEECHDALAPVEDPDAALAACERVAVLPQAVAAVDLALWDLAGRRADKPVWELLGATDRPAVPVNATIASADRSGAASEAAAARDAGFGTIKVKAGIGDDAGRIAAVRAAAGPAISIRIDANGSWSVDEALATLRVLAPAGIELCEEPASGLDAIAAVSARAEVPVALDESARLPGALDARHADAVCLKIAGCAGITGVIAAARRARAAGYEVYLASTLDGPLGISAALHAAAIVAPERPCGLATLGLFEGRPDPLAPVGGRITAPAGPGLGIDPRGWYM